MVVGNGMWMLSHPHYPPTLFPPCLLCSSAHACAAYEHRCLIVSERGMLYQKLRDYRRAVKELVKATDLDPSNAQASCWSWAGLA
jgi:hypothetical protein